VLTGKSSKSDVMAGAKQGLQRIGGQIAALLYPPKCLTCDADVEVPGALCPSCWPQVPFIAGSVCDKCGAPVRGGEYGEVLICDDCIHIARPWDRGRAVMLYGEKSRQIVLGLKYYDRHDSAAAAGRWLARAAAPLIGPDTLIAPVPLHWTRLFQRRYNQSALLAATMARATGCAAVPDLLLRKRRTAKQDGRSREARFANLRGTIALHPRHVERIQGRHILLVDDVMTSGATLAASTEACFAAGADSVDVAVLARVTHPD
jgi:ComF family protein